MNAYSFSKRTDWPLDTNKITQTLKTLKESNTPILDLTQSNPTACGLSYPQDLLGAFNSLDNLSYEPNPQGTLRAREAVAAYYQKRGINVDVDRIFLTASTSEAYNFLFRLLANYGDHILFPQPSYPLFSFLVDLNDIVMDRYRLSLKNNWAVDFDHIAHQIESYTRAVVLVNPNNPTGSYIHQNELDQLNKICAGYRLPLICDEVFWEFPIEPKENPVSLIENKEVLTFTLGGLSKSLGLPQMKCSWIIVSGPQKDLNQALKRLEVIADTFLSVGTPIQNALAGWLKGFEHIQGSINKRIKGNYAFLKKHVSALKSCQLLSCEGGWYVVLKASHSRSEEQWVLKLLSKYHVFVHPGFFFDFEEEGFLILSLLTKPKVFEEGLLRLLSRIEQEVS